mgnify:CR=1 FL=1
MCRILLSINPEHVYNILNGTKHFEYRKSKCKRNVDQIIIYATHPIKQVVAIAALDDILEGEPDDIWEQTKSFSGINRDFYSKYYEGRERAVAYKLSHVEKLNPPKSISEFGLSVAPQSFAYV